MKFALGLIALLLIAPAATAAPDNAGVRKELQAAYDRMSAGFLRRDAKPLIDSLAPDFTNADPGEKPQSRQQFEEQMKGFMAMTKSVDKCEMKIKKLDVKGPKAVADVRSVVKIKMADAEGKLTTMEVDMVDRETWVRKNGRWLLKNSVSLPGGKFLVNGKPQKVK